MNALRTLTLAATTLAIAASISAPAAATQQITRIGLTLLNSGFDAVRTLDGWLEEDESDTFSIRLQGGVEHAFVGDCDDDCTDLDLELRNSAGAVVAKDTDSDAFPAIRFTPAASGTYRLRVIMYRCGIEPCEYAIEQYRR